MTTAQNTFASITGNIDGPRLYRILDSSMVRVCVVRGPSGSGKTTLLRGWIAQRERQPELLWVSLAAGVRGRQAFWQHVTTSAFRLGGLTDAEAAHVRSQLSAAVDPVRIATAVLRDAGPVILAFDAYEHLGDALEQIDEDLTRLLAALPDLRVILTTRGGTALADLDHDNGVTRVIAFSDLALTVDEVGELIALQTGIDDERLARTVASATRGFPLTVRAVALALSQLGRIPNVDSMEWDAVVAAKLESLLPDARTRQFVTLTSVAPYLDLELARALTGSEDAEAQLAVLERNGFGRWIPYAHNVSVFQYVETIRETFRARAADDAKLFAAACGATAQWLFAHGDVDQALLYAIEGEDYALADRIFVQLMITDPGCYTSDRFLPTLRAVPEGVLPEYPMLAFGLGLALSFNPLLRAEGRRFFQVVLDSTACPDYIHPRVDAFSLVSLRAIALRLVGRYQESAEAALEVARASEDTPAELLEMFSDHYGTVLRQLSFSVLQGGLIEEALAIVSRSVVLCTSQTTRDYSTVFGAGASAFSGNLARSNALLNSIDWGDRPHELRESSMYGMALVAEGYACLDAMDFAGALRVLNSTSSYIQTTEFWPFLTGISVAARIGAGQGAAEARRVTSVLSTAFPSIGVADNVATESLYGLVAFAWMAADDQRAAGELLSRMPTDSPHLGAARVAWLLAAGEDRTALDLATTLLGAPGHTLRTRAEIQTFGAIAALRLERLETARAWLDDAAVVWEMHGPRWHVALIAPGDRARLAAFVRVQQSPGLRRYLDVPGAESAGVVAPVSLTPREQVVLAALAEHGSIREIAADLVVSPHTVKAQLQSVYRKLGVSSREAALAVGREFGLV